MRVELGAPVVLVAGVEALWHLPATGWRTTTRTACGLDGLEYAYSSLIRERRLCRVCANRAATVDHTVRGAGPLPDRARNGGRGKPRARTARVTGPQLAAIYHGLYTGQQMSVNAIAELLHERLGYPDARACSASLDRLLRDRGYTLRTVSEALTLRNTKHGRKPRAVNGTAADYAYRHWLKTEQGRYRPACAAVKQQPPGKGRPCTRPAAAGSDYCPSHDPAKRDRVLATLADARERSPFMKAA